MNSFESTFPPDFRQEDIKHILDYAKTGKFCQLICIPGAGKATLLRLLSDNERVRKFHLGKDADSIRFVYVNLQELSGFVDKEIVEFLIFSLTHQVPTQKDILHLKKQFKDTIVQESQKTKIVFLFDHFDEIQHHLGRSFYQLLEDTKDLAKYKFAAVFATRRNLTELLDEEITRYFWGFFVGNSVYLKIYDHKAVDLIFAQTEKVHGKKLTEGQKKEIVGLTGGHAKLTKIISDLLLSQKTSLSAESALESNRIKATLLEIWLFLTAEEQHDLYHLAKAETHGENSLENLKKMDLVSEKGFTIPLFKDFVKTMPPGSAEPKIVLDSQTGEIVKGQSVISELLSSQEYRLMKFLIENEGQTIERDKLIEAVWPQTKVAEAISDEAIDQMIFRLRKKIEEEPAKPKHITTIKGRGIRFNS